MPVFAVDTHDAVKRLVVAGLETVIAEEVVRLVGAVVADNVATKADLENFETRLSAELAKRLHEHGEALRAKFNRRIDEVRDGLGGRIEGVEKRIEGVEKRIEGVEKRIEGVEKRIEGLSRQIEYHAKQLVNVNRKLTLVMFGYGPVVIGLLLKIAFFS